MRAIILGLALLAVVVPPALQAQTAPAQGAAPAAATADDDRRFRDVTGYRFAAVASTSRALQLAGYAMQLREYCADARVPDDFVRAQLTRFSAITGRSETCQTLLAY